MESAASSKASEDAVGDPQLLRHCAHCLKEISGSLIKKCAKCKKRAYCSRECQMQDWSVTGTGQCHKNWCCKHEYGEEDIDWEVAPVPDKGLGVKAKRLLPAGFRIIVEPEFNDPNDHPGIKDLEPKGGSLEDKFKLNVFGTSEEGDKSSLGLRSSRVNHSCRANAAISYDDTARVRILFALRDIQPNEEICISYSYFCNFSSNTPLTGVHAVLRNMFKNDQYPEVFEFEVMRQSLKDGWEIVCPPDCFCKDRRVMKLCMEGKQLYKEMLSLASKGRIEDSLKAGEKLLEIDRELNPSWSQRVVITFYMFEFAMVNPKTKKKARQYLQSCFEYRQILYPFDGKTQFCRKMLNHPEEKWNEIYRPDQKRMSEVLEQVVSNLNT